MPNRNVWLLLGAVTLGGVLLIGCQPPQAGTRTGPVASAPPVNGGDSGAGTAAPAAGERTVGDASTLTGNTPGTEATDPAASSTGDRSGSSTGATMPENSPTREGDAANDLPDGSSSPDRGNPPAEGESANPPDDPEAGAEDADDLESRLPEFPGPTGEKGTEVGDTVLEISGKDTDRESFKLSEYRGRVVMLDFWGDW
jgi:hypothetical protein